MEFIDTHAHIYMDNFDSDLEAILTRCKEANVTKVVIPNVDRESIQPILKLTNEFPDLCKPMMGLHPTSVDKNYKEELAEIKKHIDSNTVAIGEIGIDLYWDKTFLKEQQEAFKIQIEWALELDLPIAIHARDAFPEIFEVLDQYKENPKFRGVFHCFTGNEEEAKKALSYNTFLLAIGGVVTFKKSHLPEVLANTVPLDKLVLETDAPFLTPTPYRGKRNEPVYVELVAKKLAEIYNVSINEIASITTANANALLNL